MKNTTCTSLSDLRAGACHTISVRAPPAVRGNLLLIPQLLVEISLRVMTMTARTRPSVKSKLSRFSALEVHPCVLQTQGHAVTQRRGVDECRPKCGTLDVQYSVRELGPFLRASVLICCRLVGWWRTD